MKTHNAITVFSQEGINHFQAKSSGPVEEKIKADNSGKAVFVGNLRDNFSLQDRIEQRKEQARKQAFHIVSEAWEGDRSIAREIDKSKRHISEWNQSSKEAQDKLRNLEKQSEQLKETYGITDESPEAKELELLRRRRAAMRGEGSLTAKEWKQTFEIEARGLSEYQRFQLEIDEQTEHNQSVIAENERRIMIENAVIRGIREERRKVHPISDATKQAEEIMDAVSREIVSMVLEEGKEKLEEEQEQREEKAEQLEEKREEQKKENSNVEELTEELTSDEMSELEYMQSNVKQEVQNIVNRMKLVAEDIKGASVDTNV